MPVNNQPAEINFVVPLYNEAEVFDTLISRLRSVMDASKHRITAILVDDGSRDGTAQLMRNLAIADPRFTAMILSRNWSHQFALTAGLTAVDATEAVMIIDGDLQDPPELVDEFFSYIRNGYDVVYAIREKRKDSLFRRVAYHSFYRILRSISYMDLPIDSGDFSMISRRVCKQLNKMPEESRYLRGMRSWVGFKQIGVAYERPERYAGSSKYSLKKMVAFALNGIFNFSEFPIKILVRIGGIAVIISVAYLIQTLIKRFVFHDVPTGFTALVFLIVLFGGLQLMAIGIIGEYIIRIFFQVKKRPLFIVDEVIKNGEELIIDN